MQPKWIIMATALGLMAATAALLQQTAGGRGLNTPGVRVTQAAIYDENGRALSAASVVLPEQLPGLAGHSAPIMATEAAGLPRDTTFGRRIYEKDGFQTQVTVVLMGLDRASIHRPAWCLGGQGWDITRTEQVDVPMTRPYRYNLPVNKLTTSKISGGKMVAGIYVYWYVSKDKITADHLGRLWTTTWKALTTGRRERWAYISYFSPCLPGEEEATFERLERVIQDSAPDFQIVAGPRVAPTLSMEAQK